MCSPRWATSRFGLCLALPTSCSANGLQLIIAVLLIVLGLTIVVNSAKSYVKSKKGSETEEVAKA